MRALFVTLLLCLCLFGFSQQQKLLDQARKQPFNFELFKEIVISTCRHPEVVISQSILETGHFSSAVFKRTNNLFAMKPNGRGYTCGKDSITGYAKYDNWVNYVLDYAFWAHERYKGGDYFAFLDSVPSKHGFHRYAKDPEYTKKLKQIIKTFD